MNSFLTGLGTAVDLTSILLGLLAVAALWLARDAQRRLRLFYTAIFCDLIGWAASYRSAELLRGSGQLAAAEYANLAMQVFAGLFVPMFAAYVLLLSGERLRGNRLLFAAGTLCLAQIVLSACVLFVYGPVGKYAPENIGNPISILSLAVLIASYIMLAVLLLTRRKKLKPRIFALLMLSLVATNFLETLFFELVLIMGMAERYFQQKDELVRQKEENLRQREEIAGQRVSLAVLQMRPHFIYNTMMSIYYLCKQDAEKAQRVTLDFTRYLQKNFTAVAQEDVVPFTEELEHTRAYLAVEQARYEEFLSVTFDTPETFFKLPPLTLQPVAENAVKHGIREGAMLHVAVTTAKTSDGFVVTVEDDGPGYALSADNKPHIAMANIRERLALMCGGTLTIEAREGGGTRVTVWVPPKSQAKGIGYAESESVEDGGIT